MIKIAKTLIKNYKRTIYYKGMILYLILGAFIFTVGMYDYSYFDMILYALSHPFVMAIFFIPSTAISIYYFKNNYLNNYNIIIRLNNKKNARKLSLLISMFLIVEIITSYLIITVLLANIFANRNQIISNDNYYKIPNIVLIIYHLIKNFIFLYVVAMITTLFKKKSYILNITIIVLLSCCFLGFIPNNMLKIFPSYCITSYHIFSNIIKDVLYSVKYLVALFLTVYFLVYKKWEQDLL